MKIFSNFDTWLPKKLYAEAVEKYGEENVCFIRRDRIYLRLRVYIPMFFALATIVLILLVMYAWTDNGVVRWLGWLAIVILVILIKILLYNKLTDYYLDFTIVSPNHITAYDQEGVFHRSTKAMDMSKVKSINVQKSDYCVVFSTMAVSCSSQKEMNTWEIYHWIISIVPSS